MAKNVSAIVELWSKFDLEAVKRDLDEKIIEIAKQLEEGDDSRKRLIEQTKEFRKNLNDEQRKLVGSILKSFQIEVDSSSKRSKLMEQVLLKLYKQLIDVPDPMPVLENAQRVQKRAEKCQDLELENKKLRETLDEYNAEFAEVKNQEVTIKSLKDKIKDLEEKSEQQVQQKLKEREKELQRSCVEKEEQFRQSQFELVKKLGDTEARNLALQSKLQHLNTDMYELKSKQDEQMNAKSLEIDMLLQDIDKLNERVLNVERLNEQYVQQLASVNQQKESDKATNLDREAAEELESRIDFLFKQNSFLIKESKLTYQTSALERELAAKEKEISHLVEDIQKLQRKSEKTLEFYESQRLQLEEKLAIHERSLEQLEYELNMKRDYDEIKKELNILKSIEFTSFSESLGEQKSLETLLLEKNRHLLNENTQLKNRSNDLQLENDKLTSEHKDLLNQNLVHKKLIVHLENDLMKLAENSSSMSALKEENGAQTSSILGLVEEKSNEVSNQTDTSLFDIVSNQRERFRQRVQELESESIGNRQQIIFLTNEIDRLRSDNVKLYEKIKFLQSNCSHNNRNNDSYLLEMDEKYTNEYEKKLDPFTKFSYQEKQKRYSNLKLHDKFTLNLGRFILSNKTARLIFVAYFAVIHLLIFLSSYNIAHHRASMRDYSAECAKVYREHMAHVHNVSAFEPPHN